MTETTTQYGDTPRSLPMAGHTHGTRSAVTCHLRCGDACFFEAPNTTDTTYFRDVAATALSRRGHGRRRLSRRALSALWPATACSCADPRADQGGTPGAERSAVQRDRAGRGDRGRRDRAARVTTGTPMIRWGDPILQGRPGVRPRTSRRRPRRAVWLQQRLPRHHRDQPPGTRGDPRVQPRVRPREDHVPARHRPRAADPHRLGRPRHVRRRAPAPAPRGTPGATSRAPGSTAGSPSTRSPPRRPGRRLRPAEDRRGPAPAAGSAAP